MHKNIQSSLFVLLLILSVTFISYGPSLSNGFVNWDDGTHLLDNPLVRSLDLDNIQEIFKPTQLLNRTYIPLTTLSFAIEYHFFEYTPWIYHTSNILLHLIVTACLFLFALRLKLPLFAAASAALLFGIHPMHVESVAWVTERKDVLYAVFYMVALLAYLRYHRHRCRWSYTAALLCGLLSLLAKPMALSLPLIFFAIDYIQKRKFSSQLILEKIPFFIIAIGIAGITYIQNIMVIKPSASVGESLLIAVWSFTFYPLKFIAPLNLTPVYPFPEPITLGNPIYMIALASLILFLTTIIYFRKYRWFIFAWLYYILSIFFLIRMSHVTDFDMVSDRFMYLPSLGFCLLGGHLIQTGFDKIKGRPWIQTGACLILLTLGVSLAIQTWHQNKIWKSGLTLWSSILINQPDNAKANNNLADYWMKQGRTDDDIISYVRTALKSQPDYADAHVNMGGLLAQRGQTQEAIKHLEFALRLKPNHSVSHANLGMAYLQQGQRQKAVEHLQRAVDLGFNPSGVRQALENLKPR